MRRRLLDECKHLIRGMEGAMEIAILTVIYLLLWKFFYGSNNFSAYSGWGKWVLSGVYAAELLVVFRLSDCFRYGHLKFVDVFVSQIVAVVIVNVITYFQLCLIANQMMSALPILLLSACDTAISCGCCYLFTRIYHVMYAPHDMLLIYGSESALDLKFKMDSRSDQYAITEIISAACDRSQINDAISHHDAVVINDIAGMKRNDILKYCYEHDVRTYIVPKISDIILEGGQDINLFDTPLKVVQGSGLSLPQRFAKRVMDIVLCLMALVPGVPAMLMIALAIKLDDHGPVLYKQKRVTRDGKTFQILKFRSMVVDAEKGGYNLTMRAHDRDPRVTRVGAILRAVHMDELPQIFNILKGDMSIVGPRPERIENVEVYARDIPEWHLREKVKGGLTGYAQIYGRYNTSPMDKTKLDIMYIEHYSLFLDIKLILMTARILFFRESTEGFEAAEKRKTKREAMIRELEQKHEQGHDDSQRYEFRMESPEGSARKADFGSL